MIKDFPKSRICVIDVLPSIEYGLKASLDFLKEHNISPQTTDGKKVMIMCCISEIERTFKNTKALYPKVICISETVKSKKVQAFIVNCMEKVMTKFYFPYCGRHDLNSPDLEFAAEASLSRQKTLKTFKKLKSKLKAK